MKKRMLSQDIVKGLAILVVCYRASFIFYNSSLSVSTR